MLKSKNLQLISKEYISKPNIAAIVVTAPTVVTILIIASATTVNPLANESIIGGSCFSIYPIPKNTPTIVAPTNASVKSAGIAAVPAPANEARPGAEEAPAVPTAFIAKEAIKPFK